MKDSCFPFMLREGESCAELTLPGYCYGDLPCDACELP